MHITQVCESESIVSHQSLPVLFVSDVVVLPGMVVSIELDESSQAAIDAARASSDGRLLVAPRLEDRYASYGVIASVEQVGRFRGGSPAAVLKADRRARIGSGVSGPGAALWVETETTDDPVTDRARELAEEYKRLVVAVLQRREAWQVIDTVHQMTDPTVIADSAGYAPYLSMDRKRELLETPDVESRLEVLIDWTREHLAEVELTDKIGEDVREGMEKSQREFLLRQQLAAIRKELGEGDPDGTDDYRGRVEAAERPRRRARGAAGERSTSSSAPATRARRPRGSGPGWTPCSSSPGAPRPRTPPTWWLPAPCSMRTTTASTRSRSGSSSTSPSAPVAPSVASRWSAAAARAP